MTPTIQLDYDELTFSFPEITQQLNALLDKHIQHRMPALRLPDDRSKLVNAVIELASGSEWAFRPHDDDAPEENARRPTRGYRIYGPPKSLETTARKLTAADVEKALRDSVRLPSPTVGISFQRTLRIPDDGNTYPLPAGLGKFRLHSVDEFADTLPAEWLKRGGVIMPMYQSEALWIRFTSDYPFAVKIASGKINAISGEPWTPDLQQNPQNYVVLPKQPWLDGFSIGEGLIRQFVAMPLGEGYTVEEQLTGKGDIGGIQLQTYPMNAETYFREEVIPDIPTTLEDILPTLFAEQLQRSEDDGIYRCFAPPSQGSGMGIGMGGLMRQEIYEDRDPITAWDQTQTRRCFIHLCNSLTWRQFTHTNPPHPPMTTTEYKRHGIPWFDYYRDDQTSLQGSELLAKLKSVHQLGKEKNTQPLPENTPITPETIIQYGNTRRPGEIREFLD